MTGNEIIIDLDVDNDIWLIVDAFIQGLNDKEIIDIYSGSFGRNLVNEIVKLLYDKKLIKELIEVP